MPRPESSIATRVSSVFVVLAAAAVLEFVLVFASHAHEPAGDETTPQAEALDLSPENTPYFELMKEREKLIEQSLNDEEIESAMSEFESRSTQCLFQSYALNLGYTWTKVQTAGNTAIADAYCDYLYWKRLAGQIDVSEVDYFYIEYYSYYYDDNSNDSGHHYNNMQLWESNSNCEATSGQVIQSHNHYVSTTKSANSTDWATQHRVTYLSSAFCPSPPCLMYFTYTNRAYLDAQPGSDLGQGDTGCFAIYFY